MSQVQLKQIISSLCNILEAFNFSKISPEDFRQAKFNKPDVTQKLWQLLFELIFYLENSKKSDFKSLTPDLVANFFGRENPENVIKYVKIKLIELSYPNEEFYKLDDESGLAGENSSRELLIAVAWLISTYQIMNIFARNSTCFNQEEHFIDNANKNENVNLIREDIERSREEYLSKEAEQDNYLDRLNFLKWLQGVIRFRTNSFYASQLEKAKLTNRAHLITKSANSSHFSCSELFLLKHPNLIDRYEKILVKNNELKSNLLTWFRNDELFWKWMESVLDERQARNEDQSVINDRIKSDFESVVVKSLREKQKQAVESERKFEESLQRLERLERSLKDKALSLSRGEIDEFSEANLVKFKSYESGLNSRFEAVLNSPYLNDLDDSKCVDQLNLELVDSGRLRLLKDSNRKGGATSSSSLSKLEADEFSIKKRTNLLKQDASVLEKLYLEDKRRAWDKCQAISSKFGDDCYVVYT